MLKDFKKYLFVLLILCPFMVSCSMSTNNEMASTPSSSTPSTVLETVEPTTEDASNSPIPVSTSSISLPEPKPAPTFDPSTPVGMHGRLNIKETYIVDENQEPFQLRGVSTHGLQWFPAFVNEGCFNTLRDDWKANVIRLAMYTDSDSGYLGNMDGLETLMREGIDLATKAGLYVIVDWHCLSDGNPNAHKDEAIRFFSEISAEYQNYPNIIYELCNEPNGADVTWDNEVKPYCETLIATIRAIDKQGIIIAGTPTWSQDIHLAAQNPLEGENIMYALHFYADTHRDSLRQRLVDCINKYKLPVFVSEFGTCDASGNTGFNEEQSDIWIDLLNEHNVSWVNWSLCDKKETASLLKPLTTSRGNWTDDDLSESGLFIKNRLLEAAGH